MIDVSQFQGIIQWSKVPRERVLVRVTVGLGLDSHGAANIHGAHLSGMIFGAYHFLEDMDGSTQADHFLKQFRPAVGNLRGMVDVEPSDFSHPSKGVTTRFYRRYKDVTGHYPIMYGNSGVLADLHLEADAANCPLMIADYGPNDGAEHPISVPVPKPWSEFSIHQYTSEGHVPGITENTVDLSKVLVAGAAILIPRPRPVIDKWEVSLVDRAGVRKKAFSRFPTAYQGRRPRAKYRGAIHVYPHRKG